MPFQERQRMAGADQVGIGDIEEAASFLAPHIYRTPLLESGYLSDRLGVSVLLKAENLQRTGSFKARGALNMLRSLSAEQTRKGVVAASAGNHAQGVAFAAARFGVPARVYMPAEAPLAKVKGTEELGAEVRLIEGSLSDALAAAQKDADATGAVLIPPFDDPRVVAGQGTLGLEIALGCAPDLVLVPVGGGGLIAGVAAAVKAGHPAARVVGVQARAAGGVARSLEQHQVVQQSPSRTIADGIAVSGPSALTLALIERYVEQIVTVSEEAISQAVVTLIERQKLVVEPAGVVGIAALQQGAVRPGRTSVVVLSGGNIDITLLGRIVEHGLTGAGRIRVMRVHLPDRPGQLRQVLDCLSSSRANVLDIQHRRGGVGLPLGIVEVDLQVETRGLEHDAQISADLQERGFRLEQTGAAVDTYVSQAALVD
jgi:threonine dehydratase